MDSSNIDIEKLNNLRIHELRDVARELGVKSPTSLTKDKIMEEIQLIVAGEKDPYYNTRKQGRPIKTEDVNLSTHADGNELPKHLQPFNTDSLVPKSYMLRCNEMEFIRTMPTDRFVAGFVELYSEGYAFLRDRTFIPKASDTFVSEQMVEKHKLLNGMYITGVERHVAPGKPYALIAIEGYDRPRDDYNSLPGGPLGDKLYSYLNTDVHFGGRYFIKNNNASDIFVNAATVAQSIHKANEGIEVKVINVKAIPERLPAESDGVEVLNIPFDTSDKDMVSAVSLYLDSVKLNAERTRVVVVLTGLSDIAKAYNNVLNGENTSKINVYTPSSVNSIISCAKSVNGGHGGITLIVLDNMISTPNIVDMMQYDVLPYFTNY